MDEHRGQAVADEDTEVLADGRHVEPHNVGEDEGKDGDGRELDEKGDYYRYETVDFFDQSEQGGAGGWSWVSALQAC